MKKIFGLFILAGFILSLGFLSADEYFSSDNVPTYLIKSEGYWNDAFKTYVHPAWTTEVDGDWVWNNQDYVTEDSAVNGEEVTFYTSLWVGECSKYVGSIDISADNTYELYWNENFIGSDMSGNAYQYKTTYDLSPYIIGGQDNNLTIYAKNFPYAGGTPTSNPAGIAYSITITCVNEDVIVPEFGAIIGVLTALGALGVFFVIRRH